MAAAAGHVVGAGTLVLAQQQQGQQQSASASTTAHPTISDAITLRLVPRRKKKVRQGARPVLQRQFQLFDQAAHEAGLCAVRILKRTALGGLVFH